MSFKKLSSDRIAILSIIVTIMSMIITAGSIGVAILQFYQNVKKDVVISEQNAEINILQQELNKYTVVSKDDIAKAHVMMCSYGDEQTGIIDKISSYLRGYGAQVDAKIDVRPKEKAPYTTEVRYFSKDNIKTAQGILGILQNKFQIIRSRISFVPESDRGDGRIEIHFNNKFLP